MKNNPIQKIMYFSSGSMNLSLCYGIKCKLWLHIKNTELELSCIILPDAYNFVKMF